MHYGTLDEAIAVFVDLGPGVLLGKIFLTSWKHTAISQFTLTIGLYYEWHREPDHNRLLTSIWFEIATPPFFSL